jgi:O-antigen/teichoic acid export membrane protein
MLSVAEVVCRATSVAVTLSLTNRLGRVGYGRVEFAFNVVFWLVLLVRDGFEAIASRELARHPRLVRPLVNHILAVKLALATTLYAGLMAVCVPAFKGDAERTLLALYGLMLFTTAVGIDYVYRGLERVGIIAISLLVRTGVYAAGVWMLVGGAGRVAWVPVCLVVGEAVGIGLIWAGYIRERGWPRPVPGRRFLGVFLRRGSPVLMIQVAQTVLTSVDFMVVAMLRPFDDLGLFAAPHRMVTAILTFGLIFQQVVFPTLARSWRTSPAEGRRSLDAIVRVMAMGLLPIAIGATVLARPLVRLLFTAEYGPSALLLALGIWRAPLLTLAFLYRAALIALNREKAGVRLLVIGAIASGPLVAVSYALFDLAGASGAIVLIAALLCIAGYVCLAREGRQPAWHHHLGRPLAASAVMVAVCLALKDVHVLLAVACGAAAYVASLTALGGLRRSDIAAVLGRA